MRKEEIFDRPPGPLGGLWSVYYLDMWKFLKRQLRDELDSGDAI